MMYVSPSFTPFLCVLSRISDSVRHRSQDICPSISQMVLKNFIRISLNIKECPEEILIQLATVLKISKSSCKTLSTFFKSSGQRLCKILLSDCIHHCHQIFKFLYPRSTRGGILFYLCPSCHLSVCPSVHPKIFFIAFFSATIDGRNLIFGHKLHIGRPYCGNRFWTRQIPTSRLSTYMRGIISEQFILFPLKQVGLILINQTGWSVGIKVLKRLVSLMLKVN